MQRRVYVLLALVVALMAPAPLALASGPSVLVSAATTADRYQPKVVFEYTSSISGLRTPDAATSDRALSRSKL